MRPSIIRKINPEKPESEIIAEAAEIIKQGGVIVFPTRCLYGLGADAMNPEAVDSVIEIKQRPQNNPILVLIHSSQQLNRLVARVPPAAEILMQHFWPGRVTLVFEARDTVSSRLTACTGKIGVRLVGHPAAVALVKQSGSPLTGTSANVSGRPACFKLPDLDAGIAEDVDLILDAGVLAAGIGSTVVDVTADPPRILREGQVSADKIRRVLAGLAR
jgi:L-threonylcarbamoyladenylate synthase